MTGAPAIQAFFDKATSTVSYLVADPASGCAAVIDPVLDFDAASGRVDTIGADNILSAASEAGFRIMLVLETHAHADHLTAARYIKAKTGAATAIGDRIVEVQKIFRSVFNIPDLLPGGNDFDHLLSAGDHFAIGGLDVEVIHTPGHTPADITYRIGDVAFVGDTLFMPDYGTARADFPGGDARALYRSIQKLLALPPETRLFPCHDYLPEKGRTNHAWQATVAEQRAGNIHIHDGIGEDAFVTMRNQRDKGLATPPLLLPAIQVNIRAGRFPSAEDNGVSYLRIPVNPAREGILKR